MDSENEMIDCCDKCSMSPCECEEKTVDIIDYFLFNGTQFYPKPNIADMLTEEQLLEIGKQVLEGNDDDIESMSKWSAGVQAGLDLCVQETEARSTPWQGACNYKSPTLAKAALQFSDRTTTELMRQRDLVTVNVVGNDEDNRKQKQADRIAIYENYQINERMSEWRDEHEKMLYLLPYHGTVFKKVYFDPSLGRNVCDLITYPNFSLDNTATSIDRLRRFSEPFSLSKNEIKEKLLSGEWSDNGIIYGDMQSDNANPNADNPSDSAQDHMTSFISQQCFYDCDCDGYEEPYNVVVQATTGKVVRVTPRYEVEDITIKLDDVTTNAFKTMGVYDKILRIQPNTNLIMYGMEHDPQGGLLYEGYGHILSALTQAINTTTNQLIDAGSLANNPCGWLAKGFRKKVGDIGFAPGEFKQTGLAAQEMQSGIMLHPTKEPSNVLYQLRNDLIAASNEYSASADLSQSLGPQAPAATTLALIQEKQLSSAAIILRIYRTMAREFKVLFKLDGQFLEESEYQDVVDDKEATAADFDANSIDIVPSANPEISSRMMRIQQANAEMAVMEAAAAAGGNIRPIIKGYYEAIGSVYTDEVFPDETPEQELQALLQRNPQLEDLVMQAQQLHQQITKKQEEALQAQNDVLIAQAQDLQAKAKKLEVDTKAAIHKTAAELDQLEANIQKTKAETFLTLEKADTEETKKQISKYEQATNLDAPTESVMEEDYQEESPSDYEEYPDDTEEVTQQVIDENTGEEKTARLVNGKWEIE